MTTRRRRWMVPLVGLLLAAPVDAGAFDLFRNDVMRRMEQRHARRLRRG